ncbi:MAG: hypothetical protein FWF25_06235, partial [Propionibacteriaceae bacterium]|nr:hypothetical protein [Propionibacteriaceae bacterium]
KIQAGAVATDKLAANAVTAAKIAAGTITATQIAANAITATQIATDAVTAVKIQAGAVATDKLAANAVTAAKIAAGTITATQIASGTITATQLAANAVTADKINASAVTADKIAANAITAAKIAAGTITATQLAANSVTSTQIAANAVTAAKVAARAITADKIVIGSTANLVPDPNMDTLADSALTPAWALDAGITLVAKGGYNGSTGVTCAPNQTATKWAYFNGGQSTWTTRAKTVNVAAQPGEKYQFSCWAKASAVCTAIPGSLNLVSVNLNDNTTATSTVNFPANLGTTWTLVTGVVSAATTLGTNMGIVPRIGFNANIAQTITVSTPILRRMNEGELIVDGAITAVKIAASAITADKIAAGAITTAKLSATAIDGMTITGATIRTTATANRGIVLNASSLTAFDASGNKTVSINGADGSASLTGVVKTSTGADSAEMSGSVYGGRPGMQFIVGGDQVKPVIFAQNSSGNGYPQESLLVMGSEQTVNSTGRTELEIKRRGQGFRIGNMHGPRGGHGVELYSDGRLDLRGVVPATAGATSMFHFGLTSSSPYIAGSWDMIYGTPVTLGNTLPFVTCISTDPVKISMTNVTSSGFTIHWDGWQSVTRKFWWFALTTQK